MSRDVFISHSSRDKTVADAVCSILEHNGLRCWIAPRDIEPGSSWADSVGSAIRDTVVLVLIVSTNSVASDQVPNEVALASHHHKAIIPFRIDDSELVGTLEYHLIRSHWIDAISPPLERRINVLAEQVLKVIDRGKVGGCTAPEAITRVAMLKSRLASPRECFCGREEELASIRTFLAEGRNLVFVEGMGGIGKSEIAKAFAARSRNEYDTVIFTTYTLSLKSLIINDYDFCIASFCRMVTQEGQLEDDDAYYIRKLQELRRLVDNRTLLIVDNFDVESDPDLEQIASLGWHILVTTRNHFDDLEYSVVQVKAIEDIEICREIFFNYYTRRNVQPGDPAVDMLIETVNHHTLAIELISRQMMASRMPPDQMLKVLAAEGMRYEFRETIRLSATGAVGRSYDFIRKVFSLAALDEEALEFMRVMVLMPLSGTEVVDIHDWCRLNGYDIIDKLIARSWLQYDEENDAVSVHPVVRDVVAAELPPSLDRCIALMESLIEVDRTNLWFAGVGEKAKFATIARSVLSVFPEPVPEYVDFFKSLQNMLSFSTDYVNAIALGEKLWCLQCRLHTEQSVQAGYMAFRIGWIYESKLDWDNTEKWMPLAFETLQRTVDDSPEQQVYLGGAAIEMIKLCCQRYRVSGDRADIEAGHECGKVALRAYTAPGVAPRLAGDAYGHLALVYFTMGDMEQAEEYVLKAVESYREHLGGEDTNTAIILDIYGQILSLKGNLPRAREVLEKSYAIKNRVFSENHPRILETCRLLAKTYMNMGLREEALNCFRRALDIARLNYYSGHSIIRELEELAAKAE